MKIAEVTFNIEMEDDEDPVEARRKILDNLYDDVTTYIDKTSHGHRLRLVFCSADDVSEILQDTVKHLSKIST